MLATTCAIVMTSIGSIRPFIPCPDCHFSGLDDFARIGVAGRYLWDAWDVVIEHHGESVDADMLARTESTIH
jgi:hypothetical protein